MDQCGQVNVGAAFFHFRVRTGLFCHAVALHWVTDFQLCCAMLTLSLFRHAKSSWDDAGVKDFDRPLAPRGETAAPRMGAFMAEHDIQPQLILCSPAQRTRQTLDLVLPHLGGDPTVVYEEGFYLARASQLLARVRKVEPHVRHIMIIGHDPGMHGLAVELAGSGAPRNMQALAAKFPTAGLAVLDFELDDWSQIEPGLGQLRLFMTPKRLAD
jgi:phosphohistidine phosphatase